MRHEAALFRMGAHANQWIETARVHRDSWGRGRGLAACHAQQPAIAGDRWVSQGAPADQLAHLTLAFGQALNESQLCRGSKRDDQIPLLGKRLSARNRV